jgi:hypothetical protein
MTSVKTETNINGTLYCITAECSPTATETVEKKLERLICRHVSDTESYQSKCETPLAMCEKVREYTIGTYK